jgi:amidohydrolase
MTIDKNTLDQTIDALQPEIRALGDELFHHPELGFREVQTGAIIKRYLKDHGFSVGKPCAYTGFTVTIGRGAPHIGLIAELDAIPTAGHPCADPKTTAAHACGHCTQVAVMLAALTALKQQIESVNGTVTLYFTPAEEFTDLAYRKELVSQGKIRYLSGKQNMIADGVFDDADCLIHLHAMGSSDYRFSLDSVLSGFTYKKITFVGRSAHAAVLPDQGINALNECALFFNALGLLRETFRDADQVRVHGIITDGGNTVNSIPAKVVYECYVRSCDPDALRETGKKVDRAAQHCAQALGGRAEIENTPGYFPLHQSAELNQVILDSLHRFADDSQIRCHEISAAAGDIGDVSLFKPTVQYGYNGFSGRIHGADLAIADPDEIYRVQPKIVAAAVSDLLNHPEKVETIKAAFVPKMSRAEYLAQLDAAG